MTFGNLCFLDKYYNMLLLFTAFYGSFVIIVDKCIVDQF